MPFLCMLIWGIGSRDQPQKAILAGLHLLEAQRGQFLLESQNRWEVFEGLEEGFRLAVYPSFRCACIAGVHGYFCASSAAKESKDLCAFLPERLEVLE